MTVGLTIQNRGAFLKMATDATALDNDIKGVIRQIAREYQIAIAAILAKPGGGRLYRGGANRGRFVTTKQKKVLFGGMRRTVTTRQQIFGPFAPTYRASRPLATPASFTGNMARSLATIFPSREKGYGAKVKVGRFRHRHLLEFGAGPAKKGKRVGAGGFRAPRPLWTPQQAKAIEDLERRLLRVIDASAAFRGI